MADKQIQEGDREEGETAPADDSHVAELAMKAIREAAAGLANQGEKESTDSQTEMVDVEIDGTKFSMTKEGAEAYSKQQAVYADNLATAGQGDTESEGEPETEDKTDFQTLFYTDPDLAVEKIEERITAKLRGEYIQDKALEIFWQDFYRENPELKEEDTFVRMVLGNKMGELGSLKGKTGRDGLATAVQSELLRIQNKGKGGKKQSSETETLEGATSGTTTPQGEDTEKAAPPGKVASIGDAIKERNVARRKASGKSS